MLAVLMNWEQYESAFVCSSLPSHMDHVWGQITHLNVIIVITAFRNTLTVLFYSVSLSDLHPNEPLIFSNLFWYINIKRQNECNSDQTQPWCLKLNRPAPTWITILKRTKRYKTASLKSDEMKYNGSQWMNDN